METLPDLPLLATGRKLVISRMRPPFVPHCYVLRLSESDLVAADTDVTEMLAIALLTARDLGKNAFNDSAAFTIIHNGHSVSRSTAAHVHMVCTGSRWHKAWFYFVLALKNWLHPLHRILGGRAR